MSQRVVQYQAVLQLAQSAPQIYDMPVLHRQMLDVLGIKNASKLIPTEEDRTPQDPVTENMNVMKLKPVKAFMYQDHEAHIKVHMAATQDPLIQQLMGQNPQAPVIQQAMMAHIAEHLGFAYRSKIQEALGADLPMPDEKMDPAVEVQLSRLIAQAAPIVLQNSQGQAAQQAAAAQAQQNQQDPVIQMQLQELELKKQELQLKEKKLATDAAAKADELHLKKEQIQGTMQLKGVELGLKTRAEQARDTAANEKEGIRLGTEIAKTRAEQALRAHEMKKQTLPKGSE
jgi:hypothetical protein